jgi:hypothetical protein
LAKPASSKSRPAKQTPRAGAKAASKKRAPKPALAPDPTPVLEEDDVVEASSISARDQRFLGRVMRFLVAIQTPAFLVRAKREGYTAEEHAEGWALWRKAAGETRPLDHWFAEQGAAAAQGNGETQAILQEIDAFENRWFPRTRNIIRRVVPRDQRDAFVAAFFKDLEQQPLGPGVVGSVSTYLGRVADLETSKAPGAKKVHATLRARGLSADRTARVQTLIASVGGANAEHAKPAVSAAQIAAAQAAQAEALEDLRDWFNDWGTTLRDVFGARDQIRLGLAVPKHGTAAEAEDAPADEPGKKPA